VGKLARKIRCSEKESLVLFRVRSRGDPGQEILEQRQGPSNSMVNISRFSAASGCQFTDQAIPVVLWFPLECGCCVGCAAEYKSQLAGCLLYRHLTPHPPLKIGGVFVCCPGTVARAERGDWASFSMLVCLDTLLVI